MESKPSPFRIHVSDEELADLRRRLQQSRLVPNEVGRGELDPNGAWSYGTDRDTLQEFLHHWLQQYDWRLWEAKLNELPHFTMPVRGLRMHFVHQRSENERAIPLLLVHGWPGSVVEFLKVLPLLKTHFHVVAPSIPGYGWSEAPKASGADAAFMAEQMHALMQQLGYEQYAAQGGDWGSIITTIVAKRHPEHCVALHLNMCLALPPNDWYAMLRFLFWVMFAVLLSKEEGAGVKSTQYFQKYETGYQKIQGTKPQTLGYGLNDSPVGLLAWILEKFQSWSDSAGGSPERSGLTKDEILTNVMIYWTTQSIASSFRLYYETLRDHPNKNKMPPGGALGGFTAVPTGVLLAKSELFKFPRRCAALCFNLKHWSVQEKGGHFFAFEQPELFARDMNTFFTEVIDFEECKRRPARKGQGLPFQPMKWLIMSALATLAVMKVRRRLTNSRL